MEAAPSLAKPVTGTVKPFSMMAYDSWSKEGERHEGETRGRSRQETHEENNKNMESRKDKESKDHLEGQNGVITTSWGARTSRA